MISMNDVDRAHVVELLGRRRKADLALDIFPPEDLPENATEFTTFTLLDRRRFDGATFGGSIGNATTLLELALIHDGLT